MKQIKALAILIMVTILIQMPCVTVIANAPQTQNSCANDDTADSTQSSSADEREFSVDVSEEELYQAYQEFLLYTENSGVPVCFDYASFKDEFYISNCHNTDSYLDKLYCIIDSFSVVPECEEQTSTEDSLTQTPVNSQTDYRAGLMYRTEILDNYEALVTELEDNNLPVDICLEVFAEEYEKTGSFDITEYCETRIAESENSQYTEFSNTSATPQSSSSSGGDKYYYRIDDGLKAKPDYQRYNIMQIAQRGDIIFDEEGSGGVFGHVAIVEGNYYSSEYDCYYVSLIESVAWKVSRGLIDAVRADERNSYLYKVYTATAEQKDLAVEFCERQLGEYWEINITHNYSESNSAWMCSQLVWAAYKNQGVDIELNGGPGGEIGVTPKDITINSTMVTHVDFRADLNTVPDGTYYLTNYKSGHRLDIRNGTPGTSVQVQQFPVGNFSEQKWQFTYHSDGRYYTIKSDITSNGTFYLDVATPSSGAHAKVKLWPTDDAPETRWFIQKDSENTYRFINGYSGLCMDIMGGSTESNADVQIYPYEGADDQKWMLSLCGERLFDDGTYYITNLKSGFRLDIRQGLLANSVQVQQFPAGNYPEQKWVLEWNSSWSCYFVKSNVTSNGTFYLDVASPSSGAHAKVKLWDECTHPEERWTIVSNGDGTYRFINGYDGLCMDIEEGSTASNADVQVYPYVGEADQKWLLQKIYE